MTLIQDCPRCGTHGLRPDQPCDPHCRMCLGDGAIVTGHGLVAYEIARQAITDHHAGNAHLTRLIDHTEPAHTCARCDPPRTDPNPAPLVLRISIAGLMATATMLTGRDLILWATGTQDTPVGAFERLSLVLLAAAFDVWLVWRLVSQARTPTTAPAKNTHWPPEPTPPPPSSSATPKAIPSPATPPRPKR